MNKSLDMQRKTFFSLLGALLLLALAAQWQSAARYLSFAPAAIPERRPVAGIALCPWREPDADRRRFFPGSTRHRTDVLVLSGRFAELKQRFGRLPLPEENPLYVHRVYAGKRLMGSVAARRVKGEYGAIEVVLAVGADGRVRGVRLQRQRAPRAIADALSACWPGAFNDKTAHSDWRLGGDIPNVSVAARASAAAIIEGVRSLLVLLDVAHAHDASSEAQHH